MEFVLVVSVENMRKSDARTIAEQHRGFLIRQSLWVRLP